MHALREDSWIHWLSSRTPYPDDRRTWLVTQGLGDYRMLTAAADVDLPAWDGLLLRHVLKGVLRGHRRRRRLLIAPVEPVASHGEQGVLAPGTDWEGVARETEEWAAGTGVAGEE
jgi:hypothetical protein